MVGGVNLVSPSGTDITDMLQLYGSASQYQQQTQGSDLFLYLNQGSGQDLVAVFENTSSLNLSSNHAIFV